MSVHPRWHDHDEDGDPAFGCGVALALIVVITSIALLAHFLITKGIIA